MRLQSTHFFGQRLNTLRIQGIRSPLLAIRSLKLEVVSDTNQFDPLLMARTMSMAENHHYLLKFFRVRPSSPAEGRKTAAIACGRKTRSLRRNYPGQLFSSKRHFFLPIIEHGSIITYTSGLSR